MDMMINRQRIAAAMAYYNLDDVEDVKPHMINASYGEFYHALDDFDEEGKLNNMPWWAARTLYSHLLSEAFENYDSGEDVLPYNLDVSSQQEMEWVIDLVQSWGVYPDDPNDGIDASESHYFINTVACGLGAYCADCWVEIYNA